MDARERESNSARAEAFFRARSNSQVDTLKVAVATCSAREPAPLERRQRANMWERRCLQSASFSVMIHGRSSFIYHGTRANGARQRSAALLYM